MAGGPDITSDFLRPPNVAAVNGTFFTCTYWNAKYFPGRNSTCFSGYKSKPEGIPRSWWTKCFLRCLAIPCWLRQPSELLFLVLGSSDVGFVDTKNSLYTHKHFKLVTCLCFLRDLFISSTTRSDLNKSAVAFSAFGSANAGTVPIPGTVFNTSISDDTLATSLSKPMLRQFQKIKYGLAA